MARQSRRKLGISILLEASVWGGAEVHTLMLARTLSAHGHEVAVAVLGDGVHRQLTALANGAFDVVSIGAAPAPSLGVLEWRRRYAGLPNDVGVFAKSWFHAGSFTLELAARAFFRSYATIEHLVPPPRPRYTTSRHLGGRIPGVGLWWFREMSARWLRTRCSKRVFTVSEAVRQGLVTGWGYPADRCVTVHNGIPVSDFKASPDARRIARDALGIPQDDFVFGVVGRLSISHKGCDVAIEAFRRFASLQSTTRAWLVFYGDGPDREILTRLAAGSAVADRIRFAGHTDSPALSFPAIDVSLMPSRIEGLPLSLMEGMASGCVPIATPAGGIPEIVCDSSVGWLVGHGDLDGLVRAMVEAFELAPDRRRLMQERCRERIVQHFSAEVQFDHLASRIEALA